MIEETPNATSVTSAADQPGSSSPLPNERGVDAALLVDQPPMGEPAEEAEPDRERLAVRAPFVAPELGHHRERERRVADEHDEQRRRRRRRSRARARRRTRTRWRPASDRAAPGSRRVPSPRCPSRRRTAAPRSCRVENGSRKCQTGPMSAQMHGHADPAVDPQEQGRDVGVARAAGDALGDDPDPAEEPDGPERVAEPGRRQRARRPIEVRRGRPHVADDDEDERQGDGRGGPDEVDGQRQPARVGRVERVRRDRRGQEEGEPEREAEARTKRR